MSNPPRYKKAPFWEGKNLGIQVGRASKVVHDGEILVGAKYAQFVGMGFLVQIDEDGNDIRKPKAPAEAKKPAKPAKKDPPKGKDDGGKKDPPADPPKGKEGDEGKGEGGDAPDPDVSALVEVYSKDELYAVAGAIDLSGRSKLNETELAVALTKEMGSVEAVAVKADELKQAAEVEKKREGSTGKSPAGKKSGEK